jgi:hypothetical protein
VYSARSDVWSLVGICALYSFLATFTKPQTFTYVNNIVVMTYVLMVEKINKGPCSIPEMGTKYVTTD